MRQLNHAEVAYLDFVLGEEALGEPCPGLHPNAALGGRPSADNGAVDAGVSAGTAAGVASGVTGVAPKKRPGTTSVTVTQVSDPHVHWSA